MYHTACNSIPAQAFLFTFTVLGNRDLVLPLLCSEYQSSLLAMRASHSMSVFRRSSAKIQIKNIDPCRRDDYYVPNAGL